MTNNDWLTVLLALIAVGAPFVLALVAWTLRTVFRLAVAMGALEARLAATEQDRAEDRAEIHDLRMVMGWARRDGHAGSGR